MAYQSIKDLRMKKYSNQIVTVLSVAIFLTMFFLFSISSLWTKYSYQKRVINLQSLALANLNKDLSASKNLSSSYDKFVSPSANIIGGNSQIPGSINGGDNAKIILDALPSTYDFPEFVTMLQNLLSVQGITINSITGTDLSGNSSVQNPGLGTIPFQISVSVSYAQLQSMILSFENSIRPIDILKISISAGSSSQSSSSNNSNQTNLTANISAQTYYQPGIKFIINKQVVN